MIWLIIVISAYFFGAVANIGDKLLLGSKRISSAPVYAFYVGVFGLGAFIFAPFGLTIPSWGILLFSLLAGAIFLTGILLLYFAIGRSEASRVIPVVGAVIPLATFFLAAALKLEKLFVWEIFGAVLLVVGGLLISFDLPIKIGKKKFFSGFRYACAAGLLMAVSYLMFKDISAKESFITWYTWTRVGIFIGAISLLLVPVWRKNIFRSFHSVKKNQKQAAVTGGIFIGNKVVGGLSTLMLNYAITLGSITLLNALVSLQYVFVLFLAGMLSQTKAHIFDEKLEFWDWVQKIIAIVIIGIGVMLVS